MNISIVIPNFNGEHLLKSNLPKLFNVLGKYKGGVIEVIVVDDFSDDNSVSFLTEYKKSNEQFNYFVNHKNLGFSSAVNRGVSEANGEIIILLNTDVIPKDNFLEPLLIHFNDLNVFAVGCMDESIENNNTILRGRGLGKWEKGILIHRKGEPNANNTLWVSGGSSAYRKAIWDKLGGLNTLYDPFYWEDIDLSYRALKSGYDLYFEPRSIVIHEHEKGSIKNKYNSNQVEIIVYRNQFIFSFSNATDLLLQLSIYFWLPIHLFRALKDKNWNFYKGFLKALLLFPQIIKRRLVYQKQFIKTDIQVIDSFRN